MNFVFNQDLWPNFHLDQKHGLLNQSATLAYILKQGPIARLQIFHPDVFVEAFFGPARFEQLSDPLVKKRDAGDGEKESPGRRRGPCLGAIARLQDGGPMPIASLT